jgi:hypothetical protein
MKNGPLRFEYFLEQLESLLQKASAEENPAWWLYKNNARTPLFMLEALCRIYAVVNGKKPFNKINNRLKAFEDALGQIDLYDYFANEFSQQPEIDAHAKEYFYKKTEQHVDSLNAYLVDKGWIGTKAVRIKKIREKLKETTWLNDKKEIKAIYDFYETAIEDINSFYEKYKNGFTDLEEQVHELRRMLRWLSIYAHALKGIVQLIDTGYSSENTKNYITDAVEQSPYNKLPEAGTNRYALLLDKTIFLSMSGLIDQLGTQKDDGLRVLLLAEAIQQSRQVNSKLALLGAYELLHLEADGLQKILNKALSIIQPFFEEEMIYKLMQGIGTATEN